MNLKEYNENLREQNIKDAIKLRNLANCLFEFIQLKGLLQEFHDRYYTTLHDREDFNFKDEVIRRLENAK